MFKYKKLAFTFVEVMIVMGLISFLYVMTTKVIQHNLEAKASSYVYNLYNNLEAMNILVTQKLLDEANNDGSSGDGSNGDGSNDGNNNGGADDNTGNGEDSNNGNGNGGTGSENNTSNKSIDEVLKQTDAKSYCNAFTKDLNLIGNADCENSSRDQNTMAQETKEVKYSCSRSYKFVVNNDGTYSEIMTPSLEEASTTCEENSDFTSDNIICSINPKEVIDGLVINNTEKAYAYNCTKIKDDEENDESTNGGENQSGSEIAFDIDVKPQNFGNSLKTANNIHLNFVTFISPNDKYKPIYKLSTTSISQEAICPAVTRAKLLSSVSKTCSFSSDSKQYGTNKYYYVSQNKCNANSYDYYAYSQVVGTFYAKQKSNNQFIVARDCKNWDLSANYNAFSLSGSTCQSYLNYTKNFNVNSNSFSKENSVLHKCLLTTGACWSKTGYKSATFYTKVYNIKYENFDALKAYYIKWNNFFTKNPDIPKETKAAIDIEGQGEGIVDDIEVREVENKNGGGHIAHFIYASIDTPFSEAQIGKNLFVFEQFKDKIIPVGYLANNANTPLKFNVITRDPQTMRIKTLNSKPLTYCEAMKYTGQDFSQYCNCKDESGKVVTKYDIDESCNNNFGCMIKAVRTTATPSKFRLF